MTDTTPLSPAALLNPCPSSQHHFSSWKIFLASRLYKNGLFALSTARTSITLAVTLKATKATGACCAGWKASVHPFLLLTTMTTKLSPAAQAILDAYRDADIDDAVTAAAVLRAAAAQFFSDWNGMCCEEHLKSIADELETQ